MNKINKDIVISLFNYFVLLIIGVFLTLRLKYSYISSDDIVDLICDFGLYHGRFIPTIFNKFIVVILPSIFNIPLQNFAFISEGILKVISTIFLIHMVAIAFFQFIRKNIFLGIIYIPILIICLIYIDYFDGRTLYDVNQFFLGYVLPIPIFLLFTYKISNYYIENKTSISEKEELLLIFLAVLLPQLNEAVGITALFFIIFGIKKLKFLKLPLYAIIIAFVFILSTYDFWKIIDDKIIDIPFDFFSLANFKEFLFVCFKALIVDNIGKWISTIILIAYIYFFNRDKETVNFIKFMVLSLLCMFIFVFISYFLGTSNNYVPSELYGVKNFWVLYFGLLYEFKIVLIAAVIYIIGFGVYKFQQNNSKYNYVLFYLILFIFLFVNIIAADKNFWNGSENEIFVGINLKEDKKKIYTFDKIAVYHLKNNRTAVLPKDYAYAILPDNIFPKDIATNNFSKEIYYKNDYLTYIKKTYGVDVSKGMSFETNDEAINYFIKNGGELTNDELKKLDFSVIHKL
jgi:hypothetical protein